jgi:hypothetical protein
MPPLVLLLVGGEKELPEFKDMVETCKAAGPLKIYSANKAVDAAGQLQVRNAGLTPSAYNVPTFVRSLPYIESCATMWRVSWSSSSQQFYFKRQRGVCRCD